MLTELEQGVKSRYRVDAPVITMASFPGY